MKPPAIIAVTNPASYFEGKAKDLNDLLDAVPIDEHTKNVALAKAAGGTAREAILSVIPLGSAISTILSWNKDANEEIQQMKRDHLLRTVIDKSENQGAALEKIKAVLTSPEGNILFNKVLWILDDNPPDPELSRHLAAALSNIADGDFIRLFENHKYALAQISLISPQAMAVLANARDWPKYTAMKMVATENGIVTNDWTSDFATAYATNISFPEDHFGKLMNTLRELRVAQLIVVRVAGQVEFGGRMRDEFEGVFTEIGALVVQYLDHTAKPA